MFSTLNFLEILTPIFSSDEIILSSQVGIIYKVKTFELFTQKMTP